MVFLSSSPAERKEKERKAMMRARLKRQADPYAEESSDPEDDEDGPGECLCVACLVFTISIILQLLSKC